MVSQGARWASSLACSPLHLMQPGKGDANATLYWFPETAIINSTDLKQHLLSHSCVGEMFKDKASGEPESPRQDLFLAFLLAWVLSPSLDFPYLAAA